MTTTIKIKTTRRDGFYAITAPGYYFEASKDFQRGGWQLRQWYDDGTGADQWSPYDHFDTLRDCKEEVDDRVNGIDFGRYEARS